MDLFFIVLGERGYGYKDSVLHRIVPGYIVQGGDFTSRDGNGQMSIYGGGGLFEDENFLVPHDSPGDDLYSDAAPLSRHAPQTQQSHPAHYAN